MQDLELYFKRKYYLIARYVAMYRLGSTFQLCYLYVAIAVPYVEDFHSCIIPRVMQDFLLLFCYCPCLLMAGKYDF